MNELLKKRIVINMASLILDCLKGLQDLEIIFSEEKCLETEFEERNLNIPGDYKVREPIETLLK